MSILCAGAARLSHRRRRRATSKFRVEGDIDMQIQTIPFIARAVCALALMLTLWPAAPGMAQSASVDDEALTPEASVETGLVSQDTPTLLDVQVGGDGSWAAVEIGPGSGALQTQQALSGGASLDALSAWLHSDVDRLLGRAGSAALTLRGQVKAGETFSLTLPCNPSTGFLWQARAEAVHVSVSPTPDAIHPITRLAGSPAICAFAVAALADGETDLTLTHSRPWLGQQAIARRAQFTAGSSAVTLATLARAISWPLPDPLPDEPPAFPADAQPRPAGETGETPANLTPAAPQQLPRYFNWCQHNKCPPIRDQGWCSSCWAFATVGVMESAVLIARPTLNPANVNFSEQFLVSCNRRGWGCNVGGWWGHDYHTSLPIVGEPMAGPVGEAAFPYQATNAPCNSPYPHRWQGRVWNYVRPGNPYSVPGVDELKQAILQYGPVAVAVRVGPQFNQYTGGVFTVNEASGPHDIDHGVVLVGWNDDAQAWILRNSWGSRWGQSGYMLIRYGVSNVGYGASYVHGARLFNRQAYFPAVRGPSPTNGVFIFPIPDGDFEGQVEAWHNTSGITNWQAHSGNWAGWLQMRSYGPTPIISQSVTVPSTASVLRFWYRVYRYPNRTCGQDYARVKLGGQIVKQYTLCASTMPTTTWAAEDINVQAWRGQRLTLAFEASTNSSGDAPVALMLDDVRFIR